ncbi:nucleotidyltransferase domain-containing protein, partial [Azospirillum sp. TSO5]|uniref:nucleotidyltransferase family protein n=1 Tax=Azospirillum sp. TSO5 TaxID=716760 RepID=UPI000D65CC2B
MQGADRDSHLSVPMVPDDLLRPVIAHFQPQKVILFGSQARGDAGDDSDYDLFVIVEDDTPPERLSWQSKYEARRTYHRAVDIVACRASVFERKRGVAGSLSNIADREGVVVYSAALDRPPTIGDSPSPPRGEGRGEGVAPRAFPKNPRRASPSP